MSLVPATSCSHWTPHITMRISRVRLPITRDLLTFVVAFAIGLLLSGSGTDLKISCLSLDSLPCVGSFALKRRSIPPLGRLAVSLGILFSRHKRDDLSFRSSGSGGSSGLSFKRASLLRDFPNSFRFNRPLYKEGLGFLTRT